MSPVAVELAQDLPTNSQPPKQSVASGPTLVIGSPSTAQDGTYPSMINELERDTVKVSEVEKQMVDRILDGGRMLISLSQGTEGTESDLNPTHSYFCNEGQVFFRSHSSLHIRIRNAWIPTDFTRYSNPQWSGALGKAPHPQHALGVGPTG